MKKEKQSSLKIILSIIATLSMVPLVFSTFFSGYKIIDSLATDKVVEVAMFDYITKGDFLLSLAFVGCMLSFVLIVAIIIHSLITILKNRKDNFLGITLCVIEILLSIMSFVVVAIFCNKNSVYITDYSLKYVMGPSTILYFVCGLTFGILSVIAYLIKPAKSKKIKS